MYAFPYAYSFHLDTLYSDSLQRLNGIIEYYIGLIQHNIYNIIVA